MEGGRGSGERSGKASTQEGMQLATGEVLSALLCAIGLFSGSLHCGFCLGSLAWRGNLAMRLAQ